MLRSTLLAIFVGLYLPASVALFTKDVLFQPPVPPRGDQKTLLGASATISGAWQTDARGSVRARPLNPWAVQRTPSNRLKRSISNLDLPTLEGLVVDIGFSSILGLAADLFCQLACERTSLGAIDWRRSIALSLFSGLYVGGFCNFVFALYEPLAAFLVLKRAPWANKNMRPGRGVNNVVKPWQEGSISSLAENLLHMPLVYLPTFFILVEGPLKGRELAYAVGELRRNWWPTLKSSWCFWGPFMSLNFAVVPAALRVRAVTSANFIWTVLLSSISAKTAI